MSRVAEIAHDFTAGRISAADADHLIASAILRSVCGKLQRLAPRQRPPRRPVQNARARRPRRGAGQRRRVGATRASPGDTGPAEAPAPIVDCRPVPVDPFGFSEGVVFESTFVLDTDDEEPTR